MPTLRRSKSLNDKICKQKNRPATDVIRDPRSSEADGRTRECVDNFQALVHLRKQTEDKARQLDLVFNYAKHFQTNGLQQKVHAPSQHLSSISVASSISCRSQPELKNDIKFRAKCEKGSELRVERNLGAVDACRQERYVKQECEFDVSARSQVGKIQRHMRPFSMIEPLTSSRDDAGSFQDELARKEQIIRNLTDSQCGLKRHNQVLLGRVDELEYELNILKECLSAHGVQCDRVKLCRQTNESRKLFLQQDDPIYTVRNSCFSNRTTVSPIHEASVSGYGSLAESCTDGLTATLHEQVTDAAGGVVEGKHRTGDGENTATYDDVTLPLPSRVVELNGDNVATKCSQNDNVMLRTNQNIGKETNNVKKIQPNIDVGDIQLAPEELLAQRNTLLSLYKSLLLENDKLLRRVQHLLDHLQMVLLENQKNLKNEIVSKLQHMTKFLYNPKGDVWHIIKSILDGVRNSEISPMLKREAMLGKQAQQQFVKLVDLIGEDYMKIGHLLMIHPDELENIDCRRSEPIEKTALVLSSWLAMSGHCTNKTISDTQVTLDRALRTTDKDIRLLNRNCISGAERRALRNTVTYVKEHVTEMSELLAHIIVSATLTAGDMAFVIEMEQSRDHLLSRLWHVCEFQEPGIVLRLCNALRHAQYPNVASRIIDELKAQSSTTPYQLADQGVEGDIDGGARMQQQLVGRDLPQPTDYQKLSSIHRTTGSSSRHDGEGITGSRRRLPPQVPSRLSNVKDIESVSSGKGGPVPITGRSTFQCINRQASSVPRERSVGLVGRAHARLMSDAQRCAVFEQDSKISRV